MQSTLMTKEAFAGLGAPDLVYVSEITAADVISDTPLQDGGGLDIDPHQTLYAVHGADGERLDVEVLLERGDGVRLAVIVQRQARAFVGEGPGRRLADAAGSAGDQDDVVSEVGEHGRITPLRVCRRHGPCPPGRRPGPGESSAPA